MGTGTQASCTTTHPKPSMVVIVTMLVEIVKMPMQFVMKGKCEDRTEISRASRMPSGDARLQVLGVGCWVLGAGCWVLGAGCWRGLRRCVERPAPIARDKRDSWQLEDLHSRHRGGYRGEPRG